MIIEILAILGQLVWIVSYMPQLIKTFKTKNVKGISLMTYVWFLIGYITIMPILFIEDIPVLIFGYIISALEVSLMIIFILKWRKK